MNAITKPAGRAYAVVDHTYDVLVAASGLYALLHIALASHA